MPSKMYLWRIAVAIVATAAFAAVWLNTPLKKNFYFMVHGDKDKLQFTVLYLSVLAMYVAIFGAVICRMSLFKSIAASALLGVSVSLSTTILVLLDGYLKNPIGVSLINGVIFQWLHMIGLIALVQCSFAIGIGSIVAYRALWWVSNKWFMHSS